MQHIFKLEFRSKLAFGVLLILVLTTLSACHVYKPVDPAAMAFSDAAKQPWKDVFFDAGTHDWQEQWTLDGLNADISHSKKGMRFFAGPTDKDDAHHAVLWTKNSFSGDIKIEYEFTKLDDETRNVVILYLHATGQDSPDFGKDISTWANKRQVPAMKLYFNHMNTYHISYAAFATVVSAPSEDYIRARRYTPDKKSGLHGTDFSPDYLRTGLFKKDVTYKMVVIKKGDDLLMKVSGDGKNYYCHWKTDTEANLNEGRIGLRHMYTRGALYKNVKVSSLK